MNKVQQNQTDLKNQLDDQFKLLIHNAEQYDAGDTLFAKPMATILRTLLHDTNKSRSLLNQLGLKNRYFYDTATAETLDNISDSFDYRNNRYSGQFLGIIGMTEIAHLVPFLDSQENRMFFGFVPFDDYWNRTILLDGKEKRFTRKDIVLDVVNKDGGAHVDTDIDESYHALTRENSMQIYAQDAGSSTFRTMNDIALINVRQIAHEILRTFCIDYPKKEMLVPDGVGVITIRFVVKRDIPTDEPAPKVTYNRVKPGRNDTCPCRSNEKYKRCHGKHFDVY